MVDSRSDWLDQASIKSRLTTLLEPVVRGHDAELVDIELKGPVQNQTVRVLVHAYTGISVDHCRNISLEVGDILDVEDPLPGRYRLEVTSPGLSRPLISDRDFSRALESNLKVIMVAGKTIRGLLVDFGDEHIILAGTAGPDEIARSEIAKATIEAEL